MRRYGFIYNPRSGDGQRRSLVHAAEAVLREAGQEVLEFGGNSDPAKAARAALDAGCEVLIACGGDGTVNAVAAAVYQTEAVLAVLPIGTLNHFARDLGIHTLADSEAVLLNGVVRQIDVGFVNGNLFVNNSGVGIYPVMVREREKVQRLGIPKWPAFLWAFVKTAVRMPFMRLRIDSDGHHTARHTSFLFVGNSAYSLEGKGLGSRNSLSAGVLTVCTAHDVGFFGLIRFAVRALFGTLRQDRDFVAFPAKRLTVHRKRRFHVSLDGEVRRLKSPLEYSINPSALRVLGPALVSGEANQQ